MGVEYISEKQNLDNQLADATDKRNVALLESAVFVGGAWIFPPLGIGGLVTGPAALYQQGRIISIENKLKKLSKLVVRGMENG